METGIAVAKILNERLRQDEKWGVQDHPDEIWLAILVEEVGELCEAVLHEKFKMGGDKDVRTEAIQIAAVALAWIECHERQEGRD